MDNDKEHLHIDYKNGGWLNCVTISGILFQEILSWCLFHCTCGGIYLSVHTTKILWTASCLGTKWYRWRRGQIPFDTNQLKKKQNLYQGVPHMYEFHSTNSNTIYYPHRTQFSDLSNNQRIREEFITKYQVRISKWYLGRIVCMSFLQFLQYLHTYQKCRKRW